MASVVTINCGVDVVLVPLAVPPQCARLFGSDGELQGEPEVHVVCRADLEAPGALVVRVPVLMGLR
jgi:hypothetical protein